MLVEKVKHVIAICRCLLLYDHEPSEQDEDRLFATDAKNRIIANCIHCHSPIELTKDEGADKDYYFVQEYMPAYNSY